MACRCPWVAQTIKNLQCRRPKFHPCLRKIPWRKGMAIHSRFLFWRTPWTEEPGRLQSMGSQKVRHDWVTNNYSECSCIILFIYIELVIVSLFHLWFWSQQDILIFNHYQNHGIAIKAICNPANSVQNAPVHLFENSNYFFLIITRNYITKKPKCHYKFLLAIL